MNFVFVSLHFRSVSEGIAFFTIRTQRKVRVQAIHNDVRISLGWS